MARQIQLRRGTAAAWSAANSILADGELGLEKDTRKFKFGDGVTAWNSLAYASAGASSLGTLARAASTANVNIASAPSVIDGVTLVNGDVVLLKAQTAAAENGPYLFTAAASALTRLSGFTTFNAIAGAVFVVMEGTTLADTLWECTADNGGTLGTTAIAFSEVEFTAARVLGTVLTGIDVATTGAVSSADNVKGAIGKLQATKADSKTELTLVDADLTAGELLLTSTHYGRMIKCNFTADATLRHQRDIDANITGDAAIIVLNLSTTKKVYIKPATGATVIGYSGKDHIRCDYNRVTTAMRKVADTLIQADYRPSPTIAALTQYGFAMAKGLGFTNGLTVMGLGLLNALDSSVTTAATGASDGTGNYGKTARERYSSAAAAINRVAGFYCTSANLRFDDTGEGGGRFPCIIYGAIADAVSAATLFFGLQNGAATDYRTVEPSTVNNHLGFLKDSTDANLQFSRRDATTTVKVDLGAGFAAAQFTRFYTEIDKNADGSAVYARAVNLETGAMWPADGSFNVYTTNLPGATLGYAPYCVRSSMANASTVAIDIVRLSVGRPG